MITKILELDPKRSKVHHEAIFLDIITFKRFHSIVSVERFHSKSCGSLGKLNTTTADNERFNKVNEFRSLDPQLQINLPTS